MLPAVQGGVLRSAKLPVLLKNNIAPFDLVYQQVAGRIEGKNKYKRMKYYFVYMKIIYYICTPNWYAFKIENIC